MTEFVHTLMNKQESVKAIINRLQREFPEVKGMGGEGEVAGWIERLGQEREMEDKLAKGRLGCRRTGGRSGMRHGCGV